ncbi:MULTISPECIES: Bug family tripartite tricarboxylate transporter substrate binding protein [Ramlibacter]|uniref:Tripartite tricarboxylate transporter substrate binding protein n=1 Tax=Ramlibacter pinisoli TaxID=2682844 RepID=A0A6N8ISY4_9BURK|nr:MULTISPECIES: tripartite tricarboxylate transporter substrate binding protein [Ramlibacter]MBA2964344.1 tripartite tricarboxylate transporter substrate binding protein [Ramlibacter sp. CGMCC 1.13660]MVQ29310.1 tripartite tricarboxylate transporter substrate binding protein [Ramlibacter pinisoli]
MRKLQSLIGSLALACFALVSPASAQTYPTKPIRLVVPYPPGGGTDTLARPLALRLAAELGQPVIVDNRGGAGGNIGMEYVARAPADGYTILLALTPQLAVNLSLFDKLPYDPRRDFAPITLLAEGPYLLVVNPSLPVHSVSELIALAKAKPGELNYATSGNGSGAHMAAELFNSMTGTRMVHTPYKGGGQALSDVLSGHVQVLFAPPVSASPHVKSGRLRALGITGTRVSAGLPNVPTLAEAGVPGYDSSVWYGVLAPAGTPRDIVMKLNTTILKILQQPDFQTLLVSNGIDPIGSSPEELTRYIDKEIVKWSKVVKAAGIKAE